MTLESDRPDCVELLLGLIDCTGVTNSATGSAVSTSAGNKRRPACDHTCKMHAEERGRQPTQTSIDALAPSKQPLNEGNVSLHCATPPVLKDTIESQPVSGLGGVTVI